MLKINRDAIYSEIKNFINDIFNFLCDDDNLDQIKEDLFNLFNMFNIKKEIINVFLDDLNEIKNYFYEDVDAMLLYDPACDNMEEIIFAYPGIYAILIYRIAHKFNEYNIKILPRMMSEYAHSVTGIDIHPKAIIGHKFVIDHGSGIVIGETSIIGDNVKIFHNVTLGASSLRDGAKLKGIKRHPTIEDDVTIYANSMILGDIIISKGSVINCGSIIYTRR